MYVYIYMIPFSMCRLYFGCWVRSVRRRTSLRSYVHTHIYLSISIYICIYIYTG